MRSSSPWWYRLRGLLFGLVYIAGFGGGWALSRLTNHRYAQTYVWIARHLAVDPRIVLSIAALFVFACWALRALGASYLRADVVWNPSAITNALVVQGPFAYTRSPLYLGNVCMAVGVGALATLPGFVIIVAGSIAVVALLVGYETAELRAQYGALVDDYVARVPALLPRLTPARIAGATPVAPALTQGLRSEIFTASLFAGMVALVAFGGAAVPAFDALLLCGWIVQQIATWNRVPSAKPPAP